MIWNDCRVGRLAKTALGGVERKEHPAGNKLPPTGVLLGGLSFPLPAGAVTRARESSKASLERLPGGQFDQLGHVAALRRGLHGSANPGPPSRGGTVLRNITWAGQRDENLD